MCYGWSCVLPGSHADIMKQSVKRRVEEALQEVIPKDAASDFDQGLIELGAIVCVPNGSPRCEECPLASICEARKQGLTGEIPVKSKAKARRIENRTVLLFKDHKELAVRSVLEEGCLPGSMNFPM